MKERKNKDNSLAITRSVTQELINKEIWEDLQKLRREKANNRMKSFDKLKEFGRNISKFIWDVLFVFLFIIISVSAGIGCQGLVKWINYGLVSDTYIYYFSYAMSALTMGLLLVFKIGADKMRKTQ